MRCEVKRGEERSDGWRELVKSGVCEESKQGEARLKHFNSQTPR